MKRVIIVRHAKSISHGYDQDFERTLTDRGIDDAERISQEMLKAGIHPDLVIASPAKRTTQTARIYCETMGYAFSNIRFDKKLYSGMTSSSLMEQLQELDDSLSTVMIVGHNPTVYYYIDALVSGFNLDVPTCSTVVVDFDIPQWALLQERTGKMTHRWIPDLL